MIPPMFPPFMAVSIAGHRQVYDPAPGAPTNSFLLMETGDYLLLETSDKIILE